ncbi:MAG: HAMP domain-containing sensor histidine kinase [Planctomycetota bacterium]
MARSSTKPARVRHAASALAGLGGLIAVALFGLATLDLGDPVGATLARLEREADSEARLVLADWSARLAGDAPIADAVGHVVRCDPSRTFGQAPVGQSSAAPGLTPFEPAATTTDAIASALLVVAREEAQRGELDAARATLERAFEDDATLAVAAGPVAAGPVAAGAIDARLEALRLARRALDFDAVARHLTHAARWRWDVGADGASARLLAYLAAAPALTPSERRPLAVSIRDALVAGELRVGAPRDRLIVDAAGARVELDPDLTALRALLEARLPLSAASDPSAPAAIAGPPRPEASPWRAAFDEPARTAAAILTALGDARPRNDAPADGWRLYDPSGAPLVPSEHVLAVRTGDGTLGAALALHRAEAIEAALEALAAADRGSPWRATFAAEVAAPRELFGRPHVAPGLTRPFRLAHANADALIRAERRRLAAIRAALVALGLAIGAATLMGARAARRAERLAELRRTFVASVSHDLRTPLASIASLAENLSDGVVAGPRAVAEYHTAIRREAARLGRLVDGLLDFARLERGELPRLALAPVDTDAWLRDLERAARAVCEPHGVALRLVHSALAATLEFDAHAVDRAVLNLVDNAVRHSGSESVTLQVDVTHGEGGARLVLQVLDAGRGLAGAGRERVAGAVHEALFAPYTTAGDTAGTGLGLAIVRSIAAAHGGAARLEPGADGVGLRASFDIALRPPEPHAQEAG